MKISMTLSILVICLFSSCKKKEILPSPDSSSKAYSNIVILGNSITYAPGTPGSEWIGPWGMAASAPEFDYVNLLTTEFRKKNTSAKVSIKNIAAFEREYSSYDLEANLAELKRLKPDLLIIRIGENAQISNQHSDEFARRYSDLITFFKQDNPNIKVLAVGSIWINDVVDKIMAEKSDFIPLKPLNSDFTNFAYGNFRDIGIQQHPSDIGMANIKNLIWAKIETLR